MKEFKPNSSIVIGVGICVDDLLEHIDRDALLSLMKEHNANPERFSKSDWDNFSNAADIISDITGRAIQDPAELFWLADKTTLTWDAISVKGETKGFLFYRPQMPWNYTETCPRSLKELHRIIINAVKRLCPGMEDNEIEELICDDLRLAQEHYWEE